MQEGSCELTPSPPLQPKSDVSDFGQLIEWPNSGKPEFRCKRGREPTAFAAAARLTYMFIRTGIRACSPLPPTSGMAPPS